MADVIRFSNNAVAVVTHELPANVSVITLQAGEGAQFPQVGIGSYFKLTLEDRRAHPVLREIAHCVGRAGDVLTLMRGQENTSAKNFPAGFVASNRMTAGSMNLIVQAAQDIGVLWLGVHVVPPTTGTDGGPIPVGALYFNPVTDLTYAWDGSSWRSQFASAPAVLFRLFYFATAGQTEFGHEVDLYGKTLTLNSIAQQPVVMHVDGLQQFLDDGSGTIGTYTVDWAANRITYTGPALAAGTKVELDQLVPASQLAPSSTDMRALRDINLDPVTGVPGEIDGVQTTFKIRDADNNPVTPETVQSLMVSLDGVQQQPGQSFTVVADNMIFTEAPPAGTRFWGQFFGVKTGMVVFVPPSTAPGQILMSDLTLSPVWSSTLDEGEY